MFWKTDAGSGHTDAPEGRPQPITATTPDAFRSSSALYSLFKSTRCTMEQNEEVGLEEVCCHEPVGKTELRP